MHLPARLSLGATVAASLVALLIVGSLDYLTGTISFHLFYILPVGIAAWYGGRRVGLVMGFCSGAVWLLMYVLTHGPMGWGVDAWETVYAIGAFTAIALIISSLRSAKDRLEKAVDELSRTSTELARSNKDLEQFAYVASHDLQEPLRMINGHLQLLEDRYRDGLDAKAVESIHYAVDGATRMSRLIASLLAYARLSTRGKEFEDVDCNQLLQTVLGDLRGAIADSGTRVTHEALPTVRGDRTQLAQVFQNLIGNAIKFRGQQPPVIHVGVQRREGQWLFSVKDNGIGIDPKDFPRMFQMFQRLRSREEYAGTGIGLALCRKIVERHGGEISLDSAPGEGTTFHFTLPVSG